MYSNDWIDSPVGNMFIFLLISWCGWLVWTGIFYIYDHLHWSWQ